MRNICRYISNEMNEEKITQSFQHAEDNLYEEALELRRSILCIICLEVYCDPVILPCRHTFCRHCITDSRIKLKCPICSSIFSKRGIITGTHLTKVVDSISLLLGSLTNALRYSSPLHILDEQYRARTSYSVFNGTRSNFNPKPRLSLVVESHDEPIVSVGTEQVLDLIESAPQQTQPLIVLDMMNTVILLDISTLPALIYPINNVDNVNVDVIKSCFDRKEATAVGEIENMMEQGNTTIVGATLSASPISGQRIVGLFRPGDLVNVTPRTWPGM